MPLQFTFVRRSLRTRYLLLATLVAVLLTVAALLASIYVNHVTTNNTYALQLRDRVNELSGQIRNAIWEYDKALHRLLLNPDDTHLQTVKHNITYAKQTLTELKNIEAIRDLALYALVIDLNEDHEALENEILKLFELRKDINWIYPMLPFINKDLLESNQEFEVATALALQEIARSDGKKYATDLYRLVAEVRDLWRLKILDFRAVIVRFAGFNVKQNISQENNIDVLHKQIEKKLDELEALGKRGVLGFETETALETMRSRSRKWYQDFQKLQQLRKSNSWRADIKYIEENIQPHQQHVFQDLRGLEQGISSWSSQNVEAVQDAAMQMIIGLWALAFLSLIFVFIVYRMIRNSVLNPISLIAKTLSNDGENLERLALNGKGSEEIDALLNAFNSMRRQIHHRQVALEHQALHDALTGLPNRALLEDRINQLLHLAHRNDSKVALMLLDLDRFKEINDTLGHPIGDRVLQKIAQRLAKVIRETDTVARLGGDEFAILSVDNDLLNLESFIKRIVTEIERMVQVDMHQLYVGVSIGVALYPQHGEDAATLIQHADIAMYEAKRGKRNFVYYAEDLDEHNINNLALVGALRAELNQPSGQLQLHYQPHIDLLSHEVLGVEALLRWTHPLMGQVSTEQVVRMAEQTSLIHMLSKWVLEEAITRCAAWQKRGMKINVAVNLSAMNLQDHELPQLINNLLKRNQLAPEYLSLEITESAVMSDPVRAREILNELAGLGINILIDDFGTGLSSLAYLKLLPVDGLKIDKSFVIDMLDDENDLIIVRSTIDLAHNLGLKVIAEGVETREVLLQLRQLKCDSAQGYYLAHPLSEVDFDVWYKTYLAKAVW